MKIFKNLVLLLITVSAIAVPETSDAQYVRRKARLKNRPNHAVVVVKRHPVVGRRAHIHYASMPRWGSFIGVAPAAAIVIRTGLHPYYFHNGIYYSPRNNSYVVVRPAPGIRIRVLPKGFRTIRVGPRKYYYYYGTFYSRVNSEEFEVSQAPPGAIVDAIPEGYEVRNVNGTEYYVLDDVYYSEIETPLVEGGVGYEVMKMKG